MPDFCPHLWQPAISDTAWSPKLKKFCILLDRARKSFRDTPVVLPHVGISLTPGGTVLNQITAGEYDFAIRELAATLPLVGRPVFLRLGYEFNGHWNNYTASAYVAAWRRIEAGIALNATTRSRVALV